MGAFLRSARAIARRWRWPPESCAPRSPISVSVAIGQSERMKSSIWAATAAAAISACVASGLRDAQIVGDRAVEEIRILRHKRDAMRGRQATNLAQVRRRRCGCAAHRIEEAQQQRGDRRLAGARGPDTALRAGARRSRTTRVERRPRRPRIGEGDTIEHQSVRDGSGAGGGGSSTVGRSAANSRAMAGRCGDWPFQAAWNSLSSRSSGRNASRARNKVMNRANGGSSPQATRQAFHDSRTADASQRQQAGNATANE